jgi:hypothetical protein
MVISSHNQGSAITAISKSSRRTHGAVWEALSARLRIYLLREVHRSLHVGEEHRHLLLLAFESGARRENLLRKVLGRVGARVAWRRFLRGARQRLPRRLKAMLEHLIVGLSEVTTPALRQELASLQTAVPGSRGSSARGGGRSSGDWRLGAAGELVSSWLGQGTRKGPRNTRKEKVRLREFCDYAMPGPCKDGVPRHGPLAAAVPFG